MFGSIQEKNIGGKWEVVVDRRMWRGEGAGQTQLQPYQRLMKISRTRILVHFLSFFSVSASAWPTYVNSPKPFATNHLSSAQYFYCTKTVRNRTPLGKILPTFLPLLSPISTPIFSFWTVWSGHTFHFLVFWWCKPDKKSVQRALCCKNLHKS